MRKAWTTGLVAVVFAFVLVTFATPIAAAAKGVTHNFAGPIVAVQRAKDKVVLPARHDNGLVRIKAVKSTTYVGVSELDALHRGQLISVDARHSNGHWFAVLIKKNFGEVPSINGCLIMRYTECPGAALQRTDLSHADLAYAKLNGANLAWANLTHANLTGARLNSAKLRNSTLSSATLTESDLGDAILHDANLSGANLARSYATWAEFDRANLTEAKLIDANLANAWFPDANLSGADLSRARIDGTDFENAIFCHTTMPNGSINDSGCPAG